MTAPLLELAHITVRFGGVTALSDISLLLTAGELVGLIGPNGAGKTTLFNLISGLVQPSSGTVCLSGRSLLGLPPDAICRLGVGRTFQNIRLFTRMSALENVALGLHARPHYSFTEAFIRTPRAWHAEANVQRQALTLLELVQLGAYARERADTLPYGLQRRLELARALATGPQLLLLDEPSAGMNAEESADLVRTIALIHREWACAILLIEHNLPVVMELCTGSRVVVLHLGQVLAEGSPQDIQRNSQVITAYLGTRCWQASTRPVDSSQPETIPTNL